MKLVDHCAALLLLAALAAPAAAQFTIGQNFSGTNINNLAPLNNGFAFVPPDTMGSVGGNRFAEFTNGTFSVYNTANGALVVPRVSLTQFWQNAGVAGLSNNPTSGTGTTDPHILYDPSIARWYAVTIDTPATGANRMLVARSDSSDPSGAWHGFGFTSNGSGQFADFPMLGHNADSLVIGTNDFSGNSFAGSSIYVVQKAGLLLPAPVANVTIIHDPGGNNLGGSAHPVVNQNNQVNTDTILSSYNTGAGLLKTSTVNNTATVPTLNTAGGFISVAAASAPPFAHQPGGPNTIDTGDARFSGAVIQQGNNIWGIQTIANGTHSELRWERIDGPSNTLQESGLIGDPNHDYYYGSIAVDANGNVVIGYTRSGETEFASSYASVGKFNGAALTLGGPTLLKAGVADYNLTFGGARNRFGDYSQTSFDPANPNHFWTIQEWVSATNVWSTQITEIIVPEPSSVALLAFGSLGLAWAARRRNRQARAHNRATV